LNEITFYDEREIEQHKYRSSKTYKILCYYSKERRIRSSPLIKESPWF